MQSHPGKCVLMKLDSHLKNLFGELGKNFRASWKFWTQEMFWQTLAGGFYFLDLRFYRCVFVSWVQYLCIIKKNKSSLLARGIIVWCRLWMCVYLLNLDIFNANLIKYVHLHYSVLCHIFTIYCYYLIQKYTILL